MKSFSEKNQFVTRWFLIAGVLATLCFSSGEGIRLLPFPSAPGAHESGSNPFEEENFQPYSLSALNSAVQTGKTGTKFQKDLKFFDCAAAASRAPQTAKLMHGLSVQNNAESIAFKSAGSPAAPSDRAPPLV